MQSKFWIIAKREALVRMNKPVFWILSFLGPVVLMILSVVPYAITSSLQEKKVILVNAPKRLSEQFPLRINDYEINLVDTSSQEAVGLFFSGTQQMLCELHVGKDTLWTIYTKEPLHPSDSLNMLRTLRLMGPSALQVEGSIVNCKGENESELPFSPLQQSIALVSSILVYFFLFTYSVSLLKGVMEEKSNKVMDLILSSVSPATWIMGKITGVGLASFVQFLMWLGISYVPFYFFKQKYGGALNSFSAKNIHASLQYVQQSEMGQALGWYDWLTMLDHINWFTLVLTMIIAMALGFILYAAVFAIIGMISGRESDAQPYVLPVTSPLIFSFITSGAIIADPHGTMAQWLSVIPFTAPVVLTLRAGLGIAFDELWLSLLSLGLTAVAMVFIAARVYKKILNQGGYLFRWKR